MARPKKNEKTIKFLEDSLRDVVDSLRKSVHDEDFKSAIILTAAKTCLMSAIDMIKGGDRGKRNKAIEKLPE